MAPHQFNTWQERLSAYREDHQELERRRRIDEARPAVIPSMLDCLVAFLAGKKTVEEFKVEFDRRTRKEWNYFGLKGTSGAMFLNTMVIHLPDQELLSERLKKVLPKPSDEETGREQLAEFQSYLAGQIEEGLIEKSQVQPSRGPFFVSGWWHVQDREEWPIYYFSARSVLKRLGEFRQSGDLAADYFEFRRTYRERAAELGLSSWEFEGLCAWLDRPKEPSSTAVTTELPSTERVWLFAPGKQASEWEAMHSDGIAAIGWDYLGDLSKYSSLEDVRAAMAAHRGPDGRSPINAGLACHQFVQDVQIGDLIVAKRGKREIVGVGKVASGYRHEPRNGSYPHVRDVNWTKKGAWTLKRDLVTKTLTNIGDYPQLVTEIKEKVLGEVDPPSPGESPYTIDDAEQDLFLEETEIEDLLALLRSRKNLILQGPPGTGKSYLARRLGWLITGDKSSERLAGVQFHQSYSYEDFVQGYRPSDSGGFERSDGPFLRFCSQALQDQHNDYVLLIDEINRGNLSRIFGELMLLIEPDKRRPDWATQLAYSQEGDSAFHVPPNLLIIGTMNTADRSLALVDYALRRRFAFFDLEPAFSRSKFQEHLSGLGVETSLREQICDRLQSLNREIRADPDLGPGYRVGHSYFCAADDDTSCDGAWYARLVETEIGPLLREYWPEDEGRARDAAAALIEEA